MQTYSEVEVHDMFNQSLSHLTTELALKANVVYTYTRRTIDTNIEILRADTASKLALTYKKDEVFNTYEVNDLFTQTLSTLDASIEYLRADTASKLLLNCNKEEVCNTYEVNDLFVQTLSTLNDGLATKAPIDGVYNKSQLDGFFILNDPYYFQAPLQQVIVIDPNRKTGTKLELRVNLSNLPELSVSDNIYSNDILVLTNLTAYNKTEINAQRAGTLPPAT
jgi:hypothetical protein